MSLAVQPAFRGQGVGTGLLDHALSAGAARGATSASLHVQADNAGAIALYAQQGFEVRCFLPGFYQANLKEPVEYHPHAFLMQRTISAETHPLPSSSRTHSA